MKIIVKFFIIFSVVFANENYTSSLAKSMVFPGWGEMAEYKNYKKEYIIKRSRLFASIEGALLFSFLVSGKLSNAYEQDYRTYAEVNADADWTGKNNAYAIQLGKFNDKQAYNDYCNIDYVNCEGYANSDESYDWSWDNDESRLRYANIRRDSEKMRDLAILMGAGMLINRLVSVFDIIAIKRNEENLFSINLEKDINKTNLVFNMKF